jgi:hypothetical protein
MFRFYRKHYAPAHGALKNGFVYLGIAGKLLLSIMRTGFRRRLARGERGSARA